MLFSTSNQIKEKLRQFVLDGELKPMSPLPSIRALAKRFGVSPTTVHKAIRMLKEEGLVSPHDRSCISVTIPSSLKGLRAKAEARTIALVIRNNPDYVREGPGYPGEVIRVLRAKLAKAGFALDVVSLTGIQRLETGKFIRQSGYGGVALFEVDNDHIIREIRGLNLPLVSLDADAYRLGVSSVVFDQAQGMFRLTSHLIERGHRKIAFMRPFILNEVSNVPEIETVEELRIIGYRLAMDNAGLPVRIEEYPPMRRHLRRKLLQIFLNPDTPTAVVCVSDTFARLLASEAGQFGYDIPRELSIAGFGGSEQGFGPDGKRKITSVRTDNAGMGSEAARLLLGQLRGQTDAPERVILPTSVVKGDSSGPPPAPSRKRKTLRTGHLRDVDKISGMT